MAAQLPSRRRFHCHLGGFLSAALALLAAAAGVRSEPRPPAPSEVGVAFPHCAREPFPFAAAMAAMQTELRHEGVQRVHRLTAPGTSAQVWIEIAVECSFEAESLVIRVRDPRTSEASRTMDLSDLPVSLRPRSVALVAAELARSVWARPPAPSGGVLDEPGTDGPLPSATLPPVSAPAPSLSSQGVTAQPSPGFPGPEAGSSTSSAASSDTAASRGPEWLGSVGIRAFYPDVTLLMGARVGVRYRRLRTGLEGLAGARHDVLGDVTLGSVVAWAGIDALAYRSPRAAAHAGPRVAAGAALAGTRTLGPSRLAAEPYLDAAVEAGTDLKLSASWAMGIELETGYARGVSVRADERHAGTVGGWLFGARLGVAMLP
jgi:hypothetical protein